LDIHKKKKQRIPKEKDKTIQTSVISQAIESLEIASTTNKSRNYLTEEPQSKQSAAVAFLQNEFIR